MAEIDLKPGYQNSYRLIYPNAPKMREVERWRVFGYTREQLRETRSESEVSGYDCDGHAHVLEYAAHLLNRGAEFIVLQKVYEGDSDAGVGLGSV